MEERTLNEGSKLELIDHHRNGDKHTYYSVMTLMVFFGARFDCKAGMLKGGCIF